MKGLEEVVEEEGFVGLKIEEFEEAEEMSFA